MTNANLPLNHIHKTWRPLVSEALSQVDPNYIAQLIQHQSWLPGIENIFNAFSIAKPDANYIMFGESPYPRKASANGYAFWDNAVTTLWSETGLSKQVNRATSLRTFINMLLICEEKLQISDTTQTAIAAIDKSMYVQTGRELFENMLAKGFLLLNASLVLSEQSVASDARAWRPFIRYILEALAKNEHKPTLVMFGNIAKSLAKVSSIEQFSTLSSEHPYNISFIINPKVISFFKPLHLLRKF